MALLRWSLLVVWAAVVLALTTMPDGVLPVRALTRLIGGTELATVAGHAGLFALLTLLLWLALRGWFGEHQASLLALVGALLAGTATELFQWFVDGRNATLTDLLANWLGAFVTVFISNQVMLLRRPLR